MLTGSVNKPIKLCLKQAVLVISLWWLHQIPQGPELEASTKNRLEILAVLFQVYSALSFPITMQAKISEYLKAGRR